MQPLDRQPDMTPPVHTERYKHYRFPGEIISHGVWLYYRFHLSYRDVEELLFERGIDVTYEAIRQWCRKFRQNFASAIGKPSSGKTMPISCAAGVPALETNGIWMKCF